MRSAQVVLALGLGLAAVTTGAAAADVTVSVKTEYYTIAGKDGAALLAAMDRKGPRHGFLTRAIAQTRYKVSWEFDWLRSGDDCSLHDVRAHLAITYTYPRVRGALEPALERRWKRFHAAVREHEETHGRLAQEMVVAAKKAVHGFSVQRDRTCAKTQRTVKQRMGKIVAQYEARQREYDRREHKDGGPVEGMIAYLVGRK